MTSLELTELRHGTHPVLQEAQAGRFAAEYREAAKQRLAKARRLWDLSAEHSYDMQERAARELLCAEAEAAEWGVAL